MSSDLVKLETRKQLEFNKVFFADVLGNLDS